MSNLVEHAERELRLAGLYDKDSDYGGLLAEDVVKVVKVFASAGHSGGSAMMAISLLERLLRFEPITQLTSSPEEWTDVTEPGSTDGKPLWQNRRCSSCFSNDGGKTWWDLEGKYGPKKVIQ